MFLVLFCFYIITFLYFFIGTAYFQSKYNKQLNIPGISVIVAIRNGGDSTSRIIEYLKNQIYDKNIEFILVDDESTDNTKDTIYEVIKNDSRFKYASSKSGHKNLKRKQKALDAGIQEAAFNHLLFTDVDCHIPKNWVTIMEQYYGSGYNYLVGNSIVKTNNKFNWVSSFQRIDFLLLMIICRASSYFKSPWACTGQNQGFTKNLYQRAGGFQKIRNFIGDDTAFMYLCKGYGAKLCFIDNANATVNPRVETHFVKFISQRVRWVADANKIWKLNLWFFITMLMTYLFYISIPITILSASLSYKLIGALLCIKMTMEYFLILFGAQKLSVSIFKKDFIIWQILHVPYICIVGLLSYFPYLFTWKGRKL